MKSKHAAPGLFETPRFFETLLQGRYCTEAPDLASRLSSSCSVAHQLTAAQAIEDACGLTLAEPLRNLRRLIACGEWIASHADNTAQHIRSAGNAIVVLLGGREIHPINIRVGGFYHVPQKAHLAPLTESLKQARDAAQALAQQAAQLNFPDAASDRTFLALRHDTDYPVNEGSLITSRGHRIPVQDFEHQIPETTRARYLTGPLARFNLNFDRLSPLAQDSARAVGLPQTCPNPHKAPLIRSIETLWACDEALRLIDTYEPPDRPFLDLHPKAATGQACTEAPQGICYHRYRIDEEGIIQEARIIPPSDLVFFSLQSL